MARCRIPTAPATVRAPSSSPVASAGETAVMAIDRSPSTRAAAAATSEESTPPENATMALGTVPIAASSSASALICVLGVGGDRGCCRRERFGPDLLDGTSCRGGHPGTVVVLRCEVDDSTVQKTDLDADPSPVDLHFADRAAEFVALVPPDSNAQGRRMATERLGEYALIVGWREHAEEQSRARLLHLDRGGPGVDRSGRHARIEDVGNEL